MLPLSQDELPLTRPCPHPPPPTVRSLSSSPTGPVLFSSSRDGTARSWYRPSADAMAIDGESKKEEGGGWVEGVSFTGQHEGFVNAVQWVGGDGEGECSAS